MELVDVGDSGSGCEDSSCGFSEDCPERDCSWEEPMFGLTELVCVTALYIPLMLFGLMGNILTILVVWLRPHMRSSTYLYLSSMAVSDLLILLLLPLDLYKLWRPRPWLLGDLVCKLTMFLSECCTFCTILHITFLSLERYLAVCWPITAKTVVTRRRTRTVIGCLWLGAAISAAPVLIMVGVEEVGGEELGLSQWREEGGVGWSSWVEERGGFVTGGEERGSGHVALTDGSLGEDEMKKKWSERAEAFRWVGDEEEIKLNEDGEDGERKGGANEKEDEEEKKDFEEAQQNKRKEDEGGGGGGGRAEGVDGGHGRDADMRECRCTHYAVTSGLLSAMMILSNFYFLVPLCILALVYSLIGRTLWLRPKNSRRDQSHQHTVKMLGVIVLAFVLCWLPFHVGRTIFSLSLGGGADRHEAHTDIQNASQLERLVDNKHTNISTESMTNWLINTQQPPTKTYETPPADLPDGAHNNAHTHSHPDAHLYFLYYLSQYFNLVSSVLFYLSAAINPLLYNLMSARYRHAVRSLTRKRSHTQAHRLRTLTTRHSTTTL